MMFSESAPSTIQHHCDVHLSGVQPLGTKLSYGQLCRRQPGLGALSCLDDALLLQVVGLLPPRDLVRFSAASKACYCFANHEELWKARVLQVRPSNKGQAPV